MDEIDRRIVELLVANARMSFRDLGEAVALSPNATAQRVRRLEETGVITGYRALVDPEASGRALVALIDARINGPNAAERFEALIASIDAITDAVHLTGRFDYQLRVVCANPGELDVIVRTLKTKGAVVETETRIALRSVLLARPSREA